MLIILPHCGPTFFFWSSVAFAGGQLTQKGQWLGPKPQQKYDFFSISRNNINKKKGTRLYFMQLWKKDEFYVDVIKHILPNREASCLWLVESFEHKHTQWLMFSLHVGCTLYLKLNSSNCLLRQPKKSSNSAIYLFQSGRSRVHSIYTYLHI